MAEAIHQQRISSKTFLDNDQGGEFNEDDEDGYLVKVTEPAEEYVTPNHDFRCHCDDPCGIYDDCPFERLKGLREQLDRELERKNISSAGKDRMKSTIDSLISATINSKKHDTADENGETDFDRAFHDLFKDMFKD